MAANPASINANERLRVHHLDQDRRNAALVTALCIPAGFVFIVSDFYLLGWTPAFLLLASVRFLYCVVGAYVVLAVAKTTSPRTYDRLVAGWLLFTSLVLLGIDGSRPLESRGHILIEVLVVVLIYAAYRLPLKLQVAVAVTLSAGSLVSNLLLKHSGSFTDSVAFLVAIVVTNVLGYLTSEQASAGRRIALEQLDREIELRISLERAAAAVRRLEGLLPICASCKNIRDESGRWSPVELYIRARSEAEFTHGLCPACAAEAHAGVESLRHLH